MERLRHLDNLKFIAIFTVVAWHLMSLGLHYVNEPLSVVFSSCSSYAFMFISGMLAYSKSTFDKFDFGVFLLKSSRRLLVPFIVVGGLYGYLTVQDPIAVYVGVIQHYWFLPVLFFLMIVCYVVLWLADSFFKGNLVVVGLMFFVLWCGFSVIYVKFGNVVPFYLNMCKIFPFFVLGVFAWKWEPLLVFFEKPGVAFSAIVLFALDYHFAVKLPVPLSPFFGIIFWWAFVKWSVDFIPPHFSKLGAYTLEIYVFHYFLMPNLPTLGDFLSRESRSGLLWKVIDNGNILLSGVVVIVISFAMIYCCVAFSELLKMNRWARGLFLGQWSKIESVTK